MKQDDIYHNYTVAKITRTRIKLKQRLKEISETVETREVERDILDAWC